MVDLAMAAMASGGSLGPSYHRLFKLWFAFGIPGFASVLLIIWLMAVKPSF